MVVCSSKIVQIKSHFGESYKSSKSWSWGKREFAVKFSNGRDPLCARHGRCKTRRHTTTVYHPFHSHVSLSLVPFTSANSFRKQQGDSTQRFRQSKEGPSTDLIRCQKKALQVWQSNFRIAEKLTRMQHCAECPLRTCASSDGAGLFG